MDCKVWLAPETVVTVSGIGNIKAIPHMVGHPGTEQVAPAVMGRTSVIIYGDKDDTHPIAAFYDAIGYELIGERPK